MRRPDIDRPPHQGHRHKADRLDLQRRRDLRRARPGDHRAPRARGPASAANDADD